MGSSAFFLFKNFDFTLKLLLNRFERRGTLNHPVGLGKPIRGDRKKNRNASAPEFNESE